MAIYYEQEKNDRKAIYDAADKWKNECLLKEKSLIWDGESIWTDANMSRFRKIFIERPDESGENFESKLKQQLVDESEGVYKFVIELLFIYQLFPVKSSISYKTKIEKLKTIASWKNMTINTSLPIFKSLKEGIGHPGMYFAMQKYHEISFLFLLVEHFKTMNNLENTLTNPTDLKKAVEKIQKQVGKKVQMHHVVLHLLLPDNFERIASWGHKTKITKAYSDLINEGTSDIDDKLWLIREKLENKYPDSKIDFYRSPAKDKWKDDKEDEDKDPINPISRVGNNIPSTNFNVEHFENGLVFENINVLMSQVMTALQNGKHIILTGPPGTGKSKLASKICEMYKVQSTMVTAASNWSTYETIGGYRPDREGNLYFDEGIFLECVKNKETSKPENKWLIIDEINRADIDKAFGSLFSVLTGDEVTLPFESKSGESIRMKPQGEMASVEADEHTYVVPNDWRIIATMNTIDKASLYEMSYAFMRRFAFIPVGIPKEINSGLVQQYLDIWGMNTYPNVETLTAIWKLINNYRKIGPAIVEDIAKHTQDNEDFTSAIILYVLPQFEGLPVNRIQDFITLLVDETDAIIEKNHLDDFVNDFFDVGAFE
ncbi:AAA family ATPase [Virgibacillus salinus]|uniref:AAA domain (Dynein-related subfamily) n=1 Tax=Virgibacillus salinus TaxID=553311 RepID=A0A1H1DYH4_9BACI|nr:AAA family ATPase [Virgibacillus salinus]SDQ81309.1 AAA domain (dynein-related subfamily) [Virgibacillus salinus]